MRRLTPVAVALALLLGLLVAQHSAYAAQTLDSLAKAKGRYFGSATDNPELSDSAYTSILGSEFGSITPGNSMKWDTTEPAQGSFDFTKGDAVVSFAKAHNQMVRGHTLVWHNQLPSWVSNGSWTADTLNAALKNHITTEVSHYAGQVYSWDVVNEPFNDDGTYRSDVWYNTLGTSYIANALTWAHAADPGAKLYINDYNIEGSGAKADAMYNLAKSLLAAGVPLNGIGFQGHLATQYGFPSGMQANLQRFADLGLDVAVTELDVRMILPSDDTKVATQNSYYTQVVNACLAVSRCVGITIWDYTDKYSWVPGTFSGQGNACLYDSNLAPKADYYAVVAALGGTTSPSPTTSPTGSASCKVTYTANDWGSGFTANVTITNNGSAMTSWTLAYSYTGNQTLTTGWSGNWSQSGKNVTVTNASWNGSLSTGGSASIGANFSYSGTNTAPASFTLNGTACA